MWKLVTLICAGLASALASEQLTSLEVKQSWNVCLQQCSNNMSTCLARSPNDPVCVYTYSNCIDNCDDINDGFDVIKMHHEK